MPKTLAVFGAGPGFGLALARRFGRAGFRVALVARNPQRLDSLVGQLASDGIEAAGFAAELREHDRLPSIVDAIADRFGPVDVLEYSPGGMNTTDGLAPVLEVDPASMSGPLELLLYAPLRLVRAVLPGMLERGDGGILITQAVSAIQPINLAGNFGMVMAATRNYVHNLHTALADRGVYAGTLTVAGLIDRSAVARAVAANPELTELKAELLNPDDLAETYWDMYTKRDRFEEIVGRLGG